MIDTHVALAEPEPRLRCEIQQDAPKDVLLYIVQQGADGYVKIGRSASLMSFGARLSSLQTGSPVRLEVRHHEN